MMGTKSLVLATITEGDLQRPDFFRMIGCQVNLGHPKRKESTLDYAVILDMPKERSSFGVLTRLQEAEVGLISSHPIPGAILLQPLAHAKKTPLQPMAVLVQAEDSIDRIALLNPDIVIFQVKDPEQVIHYRSNFLTVLQICIDVPEDLQAYIPFIPQFDGIWVDAPFGLEPRRHMARGLKI